MTAKQSQTVYQDKEANRGRLCVHCQRRCGTLEGGFARIAGHSVCSRPLAPGRPDCYRMVMVKFHPLRNCPECMDQQPHTYPPPRRGKGGDLLCP